ncbi:MAG: cell division protein SepF [Propionibacteriaceae bacterium]|jgi:cell division inhibitor SepF|nr:cell division protein SepF [Propionibacteriaceae bacterium]
MADRLHRVAAFILGPSAKADDDDFEAEFTDGEEQTDVVDMELAKPTHAQPRPRVVHQANPTTTPAPAAVTSLEQRRRTPARAVSMSEILHVRPYAFSEAAGIGESFKEGIPVILNLTTTDEKQAQKLIDFVSGMAFVTDGKLEKITSRVFILIPSTVHLSQTDKNQLAETHQIHD